MTSPARSTAAPAGRLTKLDTLHALDTVTASLSTMDMRRDSSSSSASSVESCSPVTPTSEMMLPGTSSKMPFGSASSSKGNDSCEEEANPEPVFSSLPPRRVFPKTQSAGALACSPTTRAFPLSPSSVSSGASTPTSPIPARRVPSFPVSRPIRPFDSISNAMGTNKTYRSVSPPPFNEMRTSVSTLEVKIPTDAALDGPKSAPIRKRFTIGGDEQCLEVKQKSKRSTKLLEPPKNNRFQNGSFVLSMTQEEFKTRAW